MVEKGQAQNKIDERQRTKVCDPLIIDCNFDVNVGIHFTDKDEECALELPSDVDPVTMVGEDSELPAVDEQAPKPENTARPRRKPSRKAKGKSTV